MFPADHFGKYKIVQAHYACLLFFDSKRAYIFTTMQEFQAKYAIKYMYIDTR